MKAAFWKVESIGNDFVMVDADNAPDDLPALAIAASNRHFGVGSDGLLVIRRGDPIELRMFNPDGSEDFCGNGLRCAMLHSVREGWADPSDIRIRHGNQIIRGREVGVGEPREGMFECAFEPASYAPRDVPTTAPAELFDAELGTFGGRVVRGSALSTGSTHTILPVASRPDDEEFEAVSRPLETAPLFPQRTSVIWVVETAPDVLSLRIWERGAGETMGCGTGSSAAALDYLRRQGRGGTVEVRNPGGSVWVEAGRWDAPPTVRGRARRIFRGLGR